MAEGLYGFQKVRQKLNFAAGKLFVDTVQATALNLGNAEIGQFTYRAEVNKDGKRQKFMARTFLMGPQVVMDQYNPEIMEEACILNDGGSYERWAKVELGDESWDAISAVESTDVGVLHTKENQIEVASMLHILAITGVVAKPLM